MVFIISSANVTVIFYFLIHTLLDNKWGGRDSHT